MSHVEGQESKANMEDSVLVEVRRFMTCGTGKRQHRGAADHVPGSQLQDPWLCPDPGLQSVWFHIMHVQGGL